MIVITRVRVLLSASSVVVVASGLSDPALARAKFLRAWRRASMIHYRQLFSLLFARDCLVYNLVFIRGLNFLRFWHILLKWWESWRCLDADKSWINKRNAFLRSIYLMTEDKKLILLIFSYKWHYFTWNIKRKISIPTLHKLSPLYTLLHELS